MSSLKIIVTLLEEPQPDGGDYEGYEPQKNSKPSRYTPLDLTSCTIPEEISSGSEED